MNPAAVLSRLKPNFSGIKLKVRLPPALGKLPVVGKFLGGKHADDEHDFNDGYNGGWDDDDAPAAKSKLNIPWKPIAVGLGVVALFGAPAAWVWMNRAATTAAWQAAVPSVTLEITGLPKAAPPPEPAPAALAADKAVPAPSAGQPITAEELANAPARLPLPGPVKLTPAPVPGLVEESKNGPLPRVAEDGRKPWQVYARPFPANDPRPRIAIIIADMGLSGVTTGNALNRLPTSVTLAFTAHAERLESWVERARDKGHEVLLSVPMEPFDYPRSDPGPNAMLVRFTADRNVERLEWSLGRFVGYTGIVSVNGGKFASDVEAIRPIIDVMRARGLLFIDPGAVRRPPAQALAGQAKVPRALIDNQIDRDLSRGAIDDQLTELEKLAKENGAAVGAGLPYPTTIERVELWARAVSDRGILVAPISAVVDRQKTLTLDVPENTGHSAPVPAPVKAAPAKPAESHGAAPAAKAPAHH